MRIGINLDKNVIVALHAHGIPPEKIAEYVSRSVVTEVVAGVQRVINESGLSKIKEDAR